MRINLSTYPTPNKTYIAQFPKLTGGLNLWELDYRMDPDQSPDVRNLWWQDGVLQCRDGQVYVSENTELGTGYTCYSTALWGHIFLHIGDKLWCVDMEQEPLVLTELSSGVPQNRGTFFRYLDWLFYKNKGGFYRITYRPEGDPIFLVESVADLAYTPVVVINASPTTGSGTAYQPENRLSSVKTVRYNAEDGVRSYQLPAKGIDQVRSVVVAGVTKTEGRDYTIDAAQGRVNFTTAPPVTNPPTNNTVEITYCKTNANAYRSVMDCPYAFVAGGNQNLCILLAGCEAQPNAIFWNSNDAISMNAAYFPMSYYNLVGDTADPVTGFGSQYSSIHLFKTHSIGRLDFTVQRVDDRDSISFTYTTVNSRVGCDLPWTIQNVENNLVFCNTYQGVHMLRSSSAALENNVVCLSRNVNGGKERGLLKDVRQATCVTSFDDDDRYWLCAGDHVYLWDYTLSTYSEPSWFYFTDVPGVAYFRDDGHAHYHMDAQGRITKFERVFSDYGGAIEKVYRFPTCNFGSYDRLKDVTQILVAVRSDTDTDMEIRYDTDYGGRYDMTRVRAYSWRLSPRNLLHRCLSGLPYAMPVRRRPGCRHVRHFSMTFSNNVPGCDLAVVSAQIFYKYQGKER